MIDDEKILSVCHKFDQKTKEGKTPNMDITREITWNWYLTGEK